MNVVIYARFSSHSQNEQSIEGQLKVCYEYAKQNGYNVISEYIDRAISGKEAENRFEFQRMINDSAKRQFEGVLVYINLTDSQEIVMIRLYTRQNLKNMASVYFQQKKIFPMMQAVFLWKLFLKVWLNITAWSFLKK